MTALDHNHAMVGYGAGEWFCRNQKSLFHNCLAHAYIGTGKIITFAFHFFHFKTFSGKVIFSLFKSESESEYRECVEIGRNFF